MFGVEFFLKAMEALESKALHIRPLQCSRLRHQLSECQLCSTCCPTGAINWEDSLSVDADKCTGCGICATTCPNGVFEANNPSNEVLLQKIAAGLQHSHRIIFACSKYQQEIDTASIKIDNIVTVPCLGRIDESILVGGIALGAEAVVLIDALCHNCNLKSGWSIAQQTSVTTNKVLGMFGISEKVYFSARIPVLQGKKKREVVDQTPDLSSQPYSRRDFFKAMTQETKRATILAASSIVNSDEDNGKPEIRKSGLPFYLPLKRKLLLDSIKKLGQPSCSPISTDTLPFYQLKIDDNCTGCGMCAYFCPPGALKKIEEAGKITITFQLSRCTKCNLCQEICYKKAISSSPNVKPDKLLNDEHDLLFMIATDTTKPEEVSREKTA